MKNIRFARFGKTWLAGAVLSSALCLGGCTNTPSDRCADSRAGVHALLQTERDFCAMARERGVAEAFRTFAAEEGMLLPLGEHPVKGRDAIFATMAEGTKYELEWSPEAAEVAKSGDLGYTWGKSIVRRTGEDGKPIVRHGKYLTVWKRQSDGTWRFVLDMGNPSPPPK